MSGIAMEIQRPDLKKAMEDARRVCSAKMFPPITREEVYRAYRMSKRTGMIFFRCTVTPLQEIK